MTVEKKVIVVALGGNALLRRGEKGTSEEQYANVCSTAKHLATLVEDGYDLVVTHGNGPQVGATLLRHDAGRIHGVPAFPMDACGAETQGFIGYLIQQGLRNELKQRNIDKYIVTIITRCIVDQDDPAFKKPSKPIGPFYKKEEMDKLKQLHPDFVFKEDTASGGWRRIVPSPDPKIIAERFTIKKLVESGFIVVTSGGGGIPIIEENGWHAVGIEAVIDKDLAGERLASLINASKYIMLTDIDAVYLNYGTKNQTRLSSISVDHAKKYMSEGHFAAGSMGPKILAAIRFIESGGDEAIIAELSQLPDANQGRAGTTVHR
jgi:carbamate kinase